MTGLGLFVTGCRTHLRLRSRGQTGLAARTAAPRGLPGKESQNGKSYRTDHPWICLADGGLGGLRIDPHGCGLILTSTYAQRAGHRVGPRPEKGRLCFVFMENVTSVLRRYHVGILSVRGSVFRAGFRVLKPVAMQIKRV